MPPVWENIIIHHSWSPDHPDYVDWENIRNYHKNIKGWSDVGYHWGVEYIGNEVKIVRGRSMLREGAHCRGYNFNSIGVVFVGNFDKFTPPEKMYHVGARLCWWLILKYPKIKESNIYPHSKYSEKTCPGKNFDMDKLISEIEYFRG